MASITPVVVDPDFIYLFLTVSFKFNSLGTTKTKDTLVSEVTKSLTTYNTNELTKFDAIFRHSQLLRQIGDVDGSITSITASPLVAKYFTPTISTTEAKSYNLYFNNALFNPHSGHNAGAGGILSSTGFKVSGENNEQFFDDDGEGNLRRYSLVGTTRSYADSQAGTIDYASGVIKINNINITAISNVDDATSTQIRLVVIPNSNDIVPVRNQILELDLTNTTSVTIGYTG